MAGGPHRALARLAGMSPEQVSENPALAQVILRHLIDEIKRQWSRVGPRVPKRPFSPLDVQTQLCMWSIGGYAPQPVLSPETMARALA